MFTVFKALKVPKRSALPSDVLRKGDKTGRPSFLLLCFHPSVLPYQTFIQPQLSDKTAQNRSTLVGEGVCSSTRSNVAHRAKHGVVCAHNVNNATMQMTLSVTIFYNAERTRCNVAIFIRVSTTPSLCQPFGFGY